MTEEEIRLIAEDYVEEYCHCLDGEYTDGSLVCAGIGTALIVSRQLEKRIAELEKENAELKADFIKSCKVKEQGFREAEQALERKDDQLTKAKEIIKKLCIRQDDYCIDCTCYKFLENMRAEAEQFLKEGA